VQKLSTADFRNIGCVFADREDCPNVNKFPVIFVFLLTALMGVIFGIVEYKRRKRAREIAAEEQQVLVEIRMRLAKERLTAVTLGVDNGMAPKPRSQQHRKLVEFGKSLRKLERDDTTDNESRSSAAKMKTARADPVLQPGAGSLSTSAMPLPNNNKRGGGANPALRSRPELSAIPSLPPLQASAFVKQHESRVGTNAGLEETVPSELMFFTPATAAGGTPRTSAQHPALAVDDLTTVASEPDHPPRLEPVNYTLPPIATASGDVAGGAGTGETTPRGGAGGLLDSVIVAPIAAPRRRRNGDGGGGDEESATPGGKTQDTAAGSAAAEGAGAPPNLASRMAAARSKASATAKDDDDDADAAAAAVGGVEAGGVEPTKPETRVQRFMRRFIIQLRREHRWLGVIFCDEYDKFTRAQRVLVGFVSLFFVFAANAIFYKASDAGVWTVIVRGIWVSLLVIPAALSVALQFRLRRPRETEDEKRKRLAANLKAETDQITADLAAVADKKRGSRRGNGGNDVSDNDHDDSDGGDGHGRRRRRSMDTGVRPLELPAGVSPNKSKKPGSKKRGGPAQDHVVLPPPNLIHAPVKLDPRASAAAHRAAWERGQAQARMEEELGVEDVDEEEDEETRRDREGRELIARALAQNRLRIANNALDLRSRARSRKSRIMTILPWWAEITGWIWGVILIMGSALLILAYGTSFDRSVHNNWLVSATMSITLENFINQPFMIGFSGVITKVMGAAFAPIIKFFAGGAGARRVTVWRGQRNNKNKKKKKKKKKR
jgi:hypothetical protein